MLDFCFLFRYKVDRSAFRKFILLIAELARCDVLRLLLWIRLNSSFPTDSVGSRMLPKGQGFSHCEHENSRKEIGRFVKEVYTSYAAANAPA